jgi:hypothetical protein
MILAHTLGTGGPDLDMTLLAGALAILGIVFFFQKVVKPAISVALLAGAVVVGAGAFALGGTQQPASAGSSNATIAITGPAEGANVPADKKITLRYDLTGGELAQDAQDSGGHLHVYIDDQLDSMPIGVAPTLRVPPGPHKISLEYSAPNHASYDPPVKDDIEVTGK